MGTTELTPCTDRTQAAAPCRLLAALALALTLINPAWAQVQTGRDSTGTLWMSDQGLPASVQPAPLELDQVMSLTPEPNVSQGVDSGRGLPAVRSPVTQQKMTPEEIATCQSVDQRYEETRVNLETIERDKANGKLLIPDSGLVTIRQNLASLARLKALCPARPAP